MPGRTTKQPAKRTSKKPSGPKAVVRSGASKRSSASFSKQLTLVALMFVMLFGAIGIVRLVGSNAATTKLSADQCYLLGRAYTSTTKTCQSKCLSGAGTYTTSGVAYAYCTNALSRTVSKLRCDTLGRVFVVNQGCARKWTLGSSANVKQCAVLTDVYTLNKPYDYCTTPLNTANVAGWAWPVPSTTSVVQFWGNPTPKGTHKGIDIGNSDGTSLNSTVVAAHAGTVTKSWTDASCGQMMVISAGGTMLYHAYQHIIPGSVVVSVGSVVAAGQPIGKVGNYGATTCGDNDGQYHIHFSVEKGNWMTYYSGDINNTVDPCTVLTGCPAASTSGTARPVEGANRL